MHVTAPQGSSMETRRLELLLDAIADHAIYMLDPDGFITSWNAGAERVKGYRAVEIIGQHFSRFFTPEARASGLPERILEHARIHGRHEAEGWRVRKDGTRFCASAITSFLKNRGHFRFSFLCIPLICAHSCSSVAHLLTGFPGFCTVL